MKSKLFASLALAFLSTLNSELSTLHAQGTEFTYQGRLHHNGAVAIGSYDLQFAIFDAAAGGNQIGSALTNNAVAVSNGLFMVTLDFGAGVFATGANRWLFLSVKTNGAVNFVPLTPLQPITATPYAITAGNLSGAVSSANLSGAYTNPVTISNAANVFAGSFAGTLTNATTGNAATATVASHVRGTLTNWTTGGGFVNVTNYGAIDDGTTDNTVAFSNACAAGAVFVPPTVNGFLISAPIYPSNDVVIFGIFGKSIIKQPLTATGPIFGGENKKTLQISGIRFDGQMATNVAQAQNGTTNSLALAVRDGVHLYNDMNSFVDHCEFLNFPGYGVKIVGDLDNVSARRGAARVDNSMFANVFCGIWFPGAYGEYAASHGCMFVRNYMGALISCGNVKLEGVGHDNYEAIVFWPGDDGRSHCDISGIWNHSTLASIYMIGATTTALIHDAFFAGGGDIYLTSGSGNHTWDNCRFTGFSIITSANTTNTFTNCKLDSEPTVTGSGTLFKWNNRLQSGALWGNGVGYDGVLIVGGVAGTLTNNTTGTAAGLSANITDGVAQAAIKELNQKVEEQRAGLHSRDVRIAEMEKRLAAIEALWKHPPRNKDCTDH